MEYEIRGEGLIPHQRKGRDIRLPSGWKGRIYLSL